MIDLHCHILPGVDDGPQNLADALAMARAAALAGVTGINATVHYMDGYYTPTVGEISKAETLLRNELTKEGVAVELYLSTEAFLTPELVDLVKGKEILTLNRCGRMLMVELPFGNLPVHAEHSLFRLQSAGITPILAHPERNAELAGNSETLSKWVRNGVLVQVNAGSFTGYFGKEAKKAAEEYLRLGLIHCVASDAHSAERRLPLLPAAYKRIKELRGQEAASVLFEENPRRLLLGKDAVFLEPVTRKSFFHRFSLEKLQLR